MASLTIMQWLLPVGFGCMWVGVQITVVSGGPRRFQREPAPAAPLGTPQRFQQFWMDQYAWIGITLSVVGALLFIAGVLS